MLQPPQPSEFEAALRKNEPVLSAANVTVRTPAVPVAFPGKPKVPEADRDRELIWTVGVSSVRFNLAELLAKPDQPVPGLELTGLQVAAGVSGFGTLNCMAYDPDAEILYLGGSAGYVVAFAASKDTTAFPEELYDHRTMSKTRLQEETLDAPAGDPERAFKVVVSEQQPGGASEPRTLTDTQLKQALTPLVKMTQAEYNAKVAANTIVAGQNILYVIVG